MEEETKKKLLQSSPKVKPHPQAREERTRSTEKKKEACSHTHWNPGAEEMEEEQS